MSVAALVALQPGGTQEGPLRRGLAFLAFLLPVLAIPLNDAGLPAGPPLIALLLYWMLRGPGLVEARTPIPQPG